MDKAEKEILKAGTHCFLQKTLHLEFFLTQNGLIGFFVLTVLPNVKANREHYCDPKVDEAHNQIKLVRKEKLKSKF